MKDFWSSCCLKSLLKQPTCFKNPENSSCIDLILKNKSGSFHNTCLVETRLSNFQRITVSVLRMNFRKLQPEVVSYRDFKMFENERFLDSLYLTLNSQNIDYTKNLDLFFNICHNELSCSKKKSTSVGLINLSWLKRCLSPSW